MPEQARPPLLPPQNDRARADSARVRAGCSISAIRPAESRHDRLIYWLDSRPELLALLELALDLRDEAEAA